MCRFCLLLFILLFPAFMSVSSADGANSKTPLRVRMIFTKIAPLLEKNNYSKAADILVEFSQKRNKPGDVYDHAEIHYTLGNCYAMMEKTSLSKDAYKETVVRDPDHIRGWQNLAKAEYDLENYVNAANAFFSMYKLTGRQGNLDPKFLYYSSVSLLMAEKYIACLEKFDQLLTDHQDSVTLEWKENYVYALMHADKVKKSLPYIVELAEGYSDEKQERWQEILLQQYIALDMYKEALTLVHGLTRDFPANPKWWKGLTHIHLQKGSYKSALAALTIYSYLSPLSQEEHKLFADLLMQQNIPGKAVKEYEISVLMKQEKETVLGLVRAYRGVSRLDLALSKLDEFGSSLPQEEYFMEQGEILYTMKKYDAAAAAFSKAGKLNEKSKARAMLMAGYSYWQIEALVKAQKSFKIAAESKKYSREAKAALQQLETVSQHLIRDAEY